MTFRMLPDWLVERVDVADGAKLLYVAIALAEWAKREDTPTRREIAIAGGHGDGVAGVEWVKRHTAALVAAGALRRDGRRWILSDPRGAAFDWPDSDGLHTTRVAHNPGHQQPDHGLSATRHPGRTQPAVMGGKGGNYQKPSLQNAEGRTPPADQPGSLATRGADLAAACRTVAADLGELEPDPVGGSDAAVIGRHLERLGVESDVLVQLARLMSASIRQKPGQLATLLERDPAMLDSALAAARADAARDRRLPSPPRDEGLRAKMRERNRRLEAEAEARAAHADPAGVLARDTEGGEA